MRIKGAKKSFPFSLPNRPEFEIPELPWDLNDVTDDELMDFYREFTAWANFLAVAVANADADEEALENRLAVIEAGYIMEGGSINIARAKRDAAEDVRKMRLDLSAAKKFRKLTEALAKNCERSANLMSRELTRRTALAHSERRHTP